MEIERKFLIDSFPEDLPLLEQAVVYQGYISVGPVVRIRSKQWEETTEYILCFKGKGTLARQEVELPLSKETFEELKGLLQASMIRKDYRVYALHGGLKLECSLVDAGEPTEFLYAEVEFETIEQALAYQPPPFLSREVTQDRSYGMGAYWLRKVKRLQQE